VMGRAILDTWDADAPINLATGEKRACPSEMLGGSLMEQILQALLGPEGTSVELVVCKVKQGKSSEKRSITAERGPLRGQAEWKMRPPKKYQSQAKTSSSRVPGLFRGDASLAPLLHRKDASSALLPTPVASVAPTSGPGALDYSSEEYM